MRKQNGFGLIEVLVGMTLLAIASLGLVKLFSMQSNSQGNITFSMKSLQEQRYLERAIWAKYEGHDNAIAACDITANSNISLDATYTCVSGKGGSVWAEAKALSDSGCVFSSYVAPVLTLSGCNGTVGTMATNINALINKSEFKVTIWAKQDVAQSLLLDPLSRICVLENSNSPASVSGANISLRMSSDCTFTNQSSGQSWATRVPKYSISMFRKGGGNDGYQRFYY